MLGSLVVNAGLFWAISRFIQANVVVPEPPIYVTLIHIPAKPAPRKVERRSNPKAIAKALPKPAVKPAPKITVFRPRPVKPAAAPNHRLLTAQGPAPARPGEFTAPPGGTAPAGAPANGEGTSSATAPPPPSPQSQQPPQQPAPQPPPAIAPPQAATPPPAAGPTQDAQAVHQELPEIPDELKSETYESFVRVRVEIEPDGSFTPYLMTSSGNTEIDRRVLAALKRWKWKPALKDGIPIRSEQIFTFKFEVD